MYMGKTPSSAMMRCFSNINTGLCNIRDKINSRDVHLLKSHIMYICANYTRIIECVAVLQFAIVFYLCESVYMFVLCVIRCFLVAKMYRRKKQDTSRCCGILKDKELERGIFSVHFLFFVVFYFTHPHLVCNGGHNYFAIIWLRVLY